MAQIVKLRRSSVAGQKPTNANLQLGELAINTTDGKVFLAKSGSGGPSVEEIVTTNTVNTGSLNLIGSVTASEFSGAFVGDGYGLYNVPTASYSYTASYVLNIPQIGVEGSTQKLTVNTPSTTWTFAHGLGERYPAIQVFDGNGAVVVPTSIETIDENTLVVKFSSAQVGIATATIGGGLPAQSPSDAGYLLRTNGSYSQWQSFDDMGLAITGSNSFNGDQTITGSLNVTSDVVVTGSLTVNGTMVMTDRPAFRVTGAGGPMNAVTTLSGSYLNVDYQQGSGWNNTTGTFTAPITGLYQVNVTVRTNSNTLGTISQLIVYKNNTGGVTGTPQIMIEFAANTTMNHTGGSTICKLNAGDTLKMVVAVGTISFDGNDNFSVAYLG